MAGINSKGRERVCGNCELGKKVFHNVSLQQFEVTSLSYTDPEGILHEHINYVAPLNTSKVVVLSSEPTNMVMRRCKFAGKHPHMVRDYAHCVNPSSFKAKSQEKSD